MTQYTHIYSGGASGRFLTGTAAEDWCQKMKIKNFTVNGDGTVDVIGSVDINHSELKRIPVRFGTVEASFYCSANRLSSLEGAPRTIGNSLNCSDNQLKTLEGGPEALIGVGSYRCERNELTDLRGVSKFYKAALIDAAHNRLTTLAGAPRHIDSLNVAFNELADLAGCPEVVELNLMVTHNRLGSIAGVPKFATVYNIDGPFAGAMTKYVVYRYVWSVSKMPRELRTALDANAIYGFVIEDDPGLAPFLYPDGVPGHVRSDSDDITSLSHFL